MCLVQPLNGDGLPDITHSWKSCPANKFNKKLGKTGQLWQHKSYDHIVRHERAMEVIRRYIRENPILANVARASSLRTNKTNKLEACATVPKRAVIEAILADYDTHYGTNHKLSEFDIHYQDEQKRIKDQQWKSGSSFQLESSTNTRAGCPHYIAHGKITRIPAQVLREAASNTDR